MNFADGLARAGLNDFAGECEGFGCGGLRRSLRRSLRIGEYLGKGERGEKKEESEEGEEFHGG